MIFIKTDFSHAVSFGLRSCVSTRELLNYFSVGRILEVRYAALFLLRRFLFTTIRKKLWQLLMLNYVSGIFFSQILEYYLAVFGK